MGSVTVTEWARPLPVGLYVLLAIVGVLLVLFARRFAISQQLRRWWIYAPRLIVLGLLFFVLLNPVKRVEFGLPSQPALVHFLVDGSRSMGLDRPRSRAAVAHEAIQQADQQVQGVADRPRVQLFRFGQRLASATGLGQLDPSDDATRLSDALEQLAGRLSRDLPRGIVVFSDGTIEDESRLAEVAAGFQWLKIPIHVFPLGDASVRGDVAIQDVVVPPRVEPNAKAPVRGILRGLGYGGERVVLQVKQAAKGDSPPIATLPLTLTGEPQPFELVVEANPDHGELLLEVPPQAGEVSEQNNRVPFQLVKTPRKIRVIYMEGTGGDEYRWVHHALQEDKDIECLSMVVDQQYAQRPRLLRIGDAYRGFPATREELFQYDCVICSDISIGAFTREQLEWTVELVAQRGGGFAMVGGVTSFGAGNWDSTAWDQLIPIDMAGGSLGRGWVYHQVRVRIPPEAESHPIWRIEEDPAKNKQVLDSMPMFLGTNYIQRLKPAAVTLAVSAEPIPNAGIMPIFAAQPYGRGRTFAFAPDTTVDWGRFFESQWGEGGNDNRYFRRFWRNVVRWLTENSIAGNKRLQVETDRVIYRLGQPIQLTARAYDEQMKQTTSYQLVARVKSEDMTSPTLELTPDGAAQSYAVQLPPKAYMRPTAESAGTNGDTAALQTREIEVIALREGKELTRTSTRVQLLADSRELDEPRARPDTLKRLALVTGGDEFRSSNDLARYLSSLPPTPGDLIVSRQPLWDSPWLWGAVVALLALEWSLRRRAGYG